jgi:hypothetical protein
MEVDDGVELEEVVVVVVVVVVIALVVVVVVTTTGCFRQRGDVVVTMEMKGAGAHC